MGQNHSRSTPEQSRNQDESSSSSTSGSAAATTSTTTANPSGPSAYSLPQTTTSMAPDTLARRPHRSVHQSILNLVKRRTTSSDSDATPTSSSHTSIPSSSSTSSRKRWRTSRRWSKAPAVPDSAQSELEPTSNALPSSEPSAIPSEPSTDKGKAKQNDPELDNALSHTDPAAILPEPSTSSASAARPSTPYPHSYVHPTLNGNARPSPWADNISQDNIEPQIPTDLGATSSDSTSRIKKQDPLPSEPLSEPFLSEQPHSIAEPVGAAHTSTEASPNVMPPPVELTPTPIQPRQFPPPGTLVVVQGVVHTTDVPPPSVPPPQYEPSAPRSTPVLNQFGLRRRASSTPRPSTPTLGERAGVASTARNRLSALIPRSRAPSTLNSSSTDVVAPGSSSDHGPASINGNDNANDSTSLSSSAQNTRNGQAETRGGATPASNGPISSSSIDVLGTLLSVAAAATAASLLTGSSEPIFSSGLPQRPNDHPPPPTFIRPTTPTPAGLGGLPFSLGSSDSDGLHAQDPFARGRDRVRHAWGSLRERLGLRGANSNHNASGDGHPQPRLRPDGTPMDAREVMLAEMARAFNLGLGLGGDGAGESNFARGHESDRDRERDSDRANGEAAPQGAATTGTATGSGRPPPAEDSFERFLMDLQSELRVVLSAPANAGEDAAPNANGNGSVAVLPNTMSSTTSATTTTTRVPGEEEMLPTLPVVSDTSATDVQDGVEVEIHDEAEEDEEEEEPSTPTSSDMPSLMEVPTSSVFPFPPPQVDEEATELDETDERDHETTPRPLSIPRSETATPTGAQASPSHRTGTGNEFRSSNGGINWWRLYRFPPITSPQGMPPPFAAAVAAAAAANAQASAASNAENNRVPPGVSSTNSSSSPSTDSSMPSEAQRNTPAPNATTVIPVIVVGLQSVNPLNRRQEREPGTTDARGQRDEDAEGTSGADDDVDLDTFPGMDGGDSGQEETQTRGRRWQSRAANAFRNLRPGRRATPGRGPPMDGVGSRTFLIYVIGGYYPPDHHIVTGANTLDSFEALWELAELLGQVKPPTVTREEIERSGLEVVRPDVLAAYEKEGKVAENCTERCLICLDDYDPADDVRLLSCRHAFHKGCVDKWLQTGRNNCPACRSRGVSTDDVPNMHPSAV